MKTLALFSSTLFLSLSLVLVGCEDQYHLKAELGPGTIMETSRLFTYKQDDGRIFVAQSSLYWDSKLVGQHCQSAEVRIDYHYVEQIDAKGCK